MRHSDLKSLRQEYITFDEKDGAYYIDLQTKKDKGRIHFRLSKVVARIYLKYQAKYSDKESPFPVISLQKFNDHLKELGKLAGLKGQWTDIHYRLGERIETFTPKTELSTHTARRTFVCIEANAGVPLDTIAAITSHSDINAMKPYLKFTTEGKEVAIRALDDILG